MIIMQQWFALEETSLKTGTESVAEMQCSINFNMYDGKRPYNQ
jgi:hypothetical protein